MRILIQINRSLALIGSKVGLLCPLVVSMCETMVWSYKKFKATNLASYYANKLNQRTNEW